MSERRRARVPGLADEGRDALMDAALQRPDVALAAWQRWQASGADSWTDPVALRWLPLVGWNLRHATLDDTSRELFRRAHRGIWAANAERLDAAAPAVAALTRAGLPIILLKGAALAHSVYDSPALRPLGDIDLLIPVEHAATGIGLLAGLGWSPVQHFAPADLALRHSLNFERPPGGAVDLHWHLLKECRWPDADMRAWRRSRSLEHGPFTGTRVLAPADQLLHVCIHGLRWSPVHSGHWVADAARVIANAGTELDWDALIDEARRRRLVLQMRRALAVLNDRSGVEIPTEVMQALESPRPSWIERLECALKGRPVRSPSGVLFLCLSRRSRRVLPVDPLPAVRYLRAAVGARSAAALVPWAARHARTWLAERVSGARGPGTSTRPRLGAGKPT